LQSPERPEAEIAAELARRVRLGDRAAEEEVVHRYSRGLLFHLRRMSGDDALADDLHQEAFRVVLERLRGKGLAEPERLAGFILRTGRNLFLGAWRKRSRHGDNVDPGEMELPDPAPDPLDEVVREEEVRSVRRLIGELGTDRDRQILFRFYVAEDDKEHICEDLGLSSLHFNRVLFRARQRFKDLLTGEGRRAGVG
jgi:RNA polymerase sigma-70 factor, ECF subfamily